MLTEIEISGDGASHYKYYYKGSQRIRQEVSGGTEVEGFIYSCDVKYEALTGGIVEAVFLDANNNEVGSQILRRIEGEGSDSMVISGNIPEDDLPSGAVSLKLRVRRESSSGYLWVGDMHLEEGEWIISDFVYNYSYDNAGNLIMVDDGNESTRYIYAGSRLLATENNGNLYFYHLDRLGSPIMITNKTGNVVKEKKYEAFGNLVWQSGTYSDNREFTGKEKDPTGFHYFGARYYSGDIGRFLSPDPHTLMPGNIDLTNSQELNPYVYCMNNPLTFVDPDGLYVVKPQSMLLTAAIRLAYRTSSTFRAQHSIAFNNKQQRAVFIARDDIRDRGYTVSSFSEFGDIKAQTITYINTSKDDGISTANSEAVKAVGHEMTHVNEQGSLRSKQELEDRYNPEKNDDVIKTRDGKGRCTKGARENESEIGKEYYHNTNEDKVYQDMSNDELDKLLFNSW